MVVLTSLKEICFGRYLWITNTVTAGLFLVVGDGIQQSIEKYKGLRRKNEPFDTDRSGRMMIVGLASGLPHHIWYTFLDKVLPGKSLLTVAKKIIVDQSLASPYFSLTFFIGSGLLEGQSLKESLKEFQSKFLMVYKTDCSVWPPAQLINFLFVPPIYRVVYINVVTVAWNVFLSYAKYFDQIQVVQEPQLMAL